MMYVCYLVSNTGDKGLDVKLCGTALLAGGVCTLQASDVQNTEVETKTIRFTCTRYNENHKISKYVKKK